MCLDSLLALDYPKDMLEIIVIDGQSQDGTLDILQQYKNKYPFIRILSNPRKIAPVALNIGIKNASHDYIMRVDAHSSISANYVTTLIEQMSLLQADCVGGVMETKITNTNPKTSSIVKVLSNKFGIGNSMFRIGTEKPIPVDTVPFGLYKKSLFEKIGLYNEELIRNQDIELSKRIINGGGKIFLIPQARCTYYARESFSKLAQNNFQNGLWNILTVYITKNLRSLSVRHYIPLFFVLSLILPLFPGYLIHPLMPVLALVSLILYNLLIIGICIRINTRDTSFLYLYWSFGVLHFSYGLGSLTGLFRFDKIF